MGWSWVTPYSCEVARPFVGVAELPPSQWPTSPLDVREGHVVDLRAYPSSSRCVSWRVGIGGCTGAAQRVDRRPRCPSRPHGIGNSPEESDEREPWRTLAVQLFRLPWRLRSSRRMAAASARTDA